MNDEPNAKDPNAEDARIDALEERLKAAQEREERRNRPTRGTSADASYRKGSKVLSELVGAIVGGAFIGWVIDQFAGTSPWGLLVMLFLGIVVAFRNLIKDSNKRPD